MLTVFEQEIVDAIVEDYDVDEEDAKIAVELASKEKFIDPNNAPEVGHWAEKIYDTTRFWEHLND